MEKLEWLQAFAEPEQPETGAAAPTPEQQERLAALSPEGTQALTQEQREAAMRQGYARLKAQFAAVQAVYPQAELSRALEAFLKTLPVARRRMFLLRYWYLMPMRDIAQRLGWTEGRVRTTLHRIRRQLLTYLQERGMLDEA